MYSAFALAPLTLATVLVVSGLAKLPDPGSTHSMMTSLRLPEAVANRGVARLLPWVELAVAALLLTPWRWTFALGSLAAALLLLAFWVVVARAMSFDPRPSCPCFGKVGDHRITWRTVVRNTVLLALAFLTAATALLGGTGLGLLAQFGTGDWVWLLLSAAPAAVAVLALGGGARPDEGGDHPVTVGQNHTDTDGRDHNDADLPDHPVAAGLLVGREVLVDRDLDVVPVRHLTGAQAQLLVLANCWCGSTFAAIERLPGWRQRLPRLDVQLVHTHAPWDEPRLHHVPGVWWDPGARVYSALEAGPSPTAVLVDTDGRAAAGPVSGVEAIEGLVAQLSSDRVRVRAPDAP